MSLGDRDLYCNSLASDWQVKDDVNYRLNLKPDISSYWTLNLHIRTKTLVGEPLRWLGKTAIVMFFEGLSAYQTN
ncbi:hypothetical protein H6G06_03240 [Anabaena sphaerica FACHB-251]|uniref:Uncharacterized protein n=1 Tax=Anabaena sphaerica FACHB-251 TaxID=2692883 RepID=A0A926ZYF6_9NOST|nr:hypothetical protein [Anabaena sphaerica]MBD2292522.1 hypothetical protein [Anabaena sphaerica FACHB-251]